MVFRLICEIEEAEGKCPVSKWLDSNMTQRERAKLHTRFNRIESDEAVNPNWLKPYTSLRMWEIRFDHGGKAFRFLCEVTDDNVIMVLATTKNGKITKQEETRAVARRAAIKNGVAGVRIYPLPERASADLGPVRR